MQFNMNNNRNFKSNNVIIEKVNKITYLRFLVDKDLNVNEDVM